MKIKYSVKFTQAEKAVQVKSDFVFKRCEKCDFEVRTREKKVILKGKNILIDQNKKELNNILFNFFFFRSNISNVSCTTIILCKTDLN